jgi:anti-sigma factor RsiW
MSGNGSHEVYEVLVVKAVDGQLTPAERAQLDAHLPSCPSCRDELRDFRHIKEATDMIRSRIMRDAEIEAPRPSARARAALGTGLVLVLIGALTLLGFSAYTFFADSAISPLVRVATGLVGAGALVLLAYVLRIRLRAVRGGRDPYREIDL